jgi:hypothetical protein
MPDFFLAFKFDPLPESVLFMALAPAALAFRSMQAASWRSCDVVGAFRGAGEFPARIFVTAFRHVSSSTNAATVAAAATRFQ